MTWKPTDEMVDTAYNVNNERHEYPSTDDMARALIAVQPLIAAEAIGKFLDEEYNSCVGGLVDYRVAEATAKVLKDAADTIDAYDPDDLAVAGRGILSAIIRSLIPKPPEGT